MSHPLHFNGLRLRIVGLYRTLRRQPIKNALLLSLLNQVISSGSNFAVGVYLARTLPLHDYGIYGICYGICMLYVGVGNAIILTQMLVTMAEVDAPQQTAYASQMLQSVLILGVLSLLLVGVTLLAAFLFDPGLADYFPTIAAVALMSILFLCKEFFIRYAYIMRVERLAVWVSGLAVAVLGVGLAIERAAGVPLTVVHVLLLSAAGMAIGALIGYRNSPLRIPPDVRGSVTAFIASWQHGRWALGGVAVSWVQSQTYTYVLAALLGPTGVGQANAARIFVSPFSFLIPAVNQIAMPRLADLRQAQPHLVMRVGLQLTAGLLVLAILYSFVLLQSLPMVADLILGRQDPAVQSLVWIWCVVVCNQMILNGGSTMLQVLRRFRALALLSAASAIAAVLSALVLVRLVGPPGAIWGVAVGEVLLSLMVWGEIRRDHARAG
jgi:O-antigen/teichoic acid export membrane protein